MAWRIILLSASLWVELNSLTSVLSCEAHTSNLSLNPPDVIISLAYDGFFLGSVDRKSLHNHTFSRKSHVVRPVMGYRKSLIIMLFSDWSLLSGTSISCAVINIPPDIYQTQYQLIHIVYLGTKQRLSMWMLSPNFS